MLKLARDTTQIRDYLAGAHLPDKLSLCRCRSLRPRAPALNSPSHKSPAPFSSDTRAMQSGLSMFDRLPEDCRGGSGKPELFARLVKRAGER